MRYGLPLARGEKLRRRDESSYFMRRGVSRTVDVQGGGAKYGDGCTACGRYDRQRACRHRVLLPPEWWRAGPASGPRGRATTGPDRALSCWLTAPSVPVFT